MELKEIANFITLMKDNDLSDFELEQEGFRIAIKRQAGGTFVTQAGAAAQPPVLMAPAVPVAAASGVAPASKPAAEEDAGLLAIASPIIGTFYRAASPDAEPFIKIGQQVEPDTTVCIIEAMKVMNEIKAEVRGTIVKISAENATSVEFGQALFKVKPA